MCVDRESSTQTAGGAESSHGHKQVCGREECMCVLSNERIDDLCFYLASLSYPTVIYGMQGLLASLSYPTVIYGMQGLLASLCNPTVIYGMQGLFHSVTLSHPDLAANQKFKLGTCVHNTQHYGQTQMQTLTITPEKCNLAGIYFSWCSCAELNLTLTVCYPHL